MPKYFSAIIHTGQRLRVPYSKPSLEAKERFDRNEKRIDDLRRKMLEDSKELDRLLDLRSHRVEEYEIAQANDVRQYMAQR